MLIIQKNSDSILEEIQKQERILAQLKGEYERKREGEDRAAVLAHSAQVPVDAQGLRAPQVQAHRGYGYYQNYPQYEQIPVGRPLNYSHNGSFAPEYPQL